MGPETCHLSSLNTRHEVTKSVVHDLANVCNNYTKFKLEQANLSGTYNLQFYLSGAPIILTEAEVVKCVIFFCSGYYHKTSGKCC